MKSVRLTRDLRSSIYRDIMENSSERKTEKERYNTLQALVPRLVTMPPEGWKKFSEWFLFDPIFYIRTSNHGELSLQAKGFPRLPGNSHTNVGINDITDPELLEAIKSYTQSLDAVKDLQQDLRALLSAVSNTKQLLEVVPDFLPVVARLTDQPEALALVPQELVERLKARNFGGTA